MFCEVTVDGELRWTLTTKMQNGKQDKRPRREKGVLMGMKCGSGFSLEAPALWSPLRPTGRAPSPHWWASWGRELFIQFSKGLSGRAMLPPALFLSCLPLVLQSLNSQGGMEGGEWLSPSPSSPHARDIPASPASPPPTGVAWEPERPARCRARISRRGSPGWGPLSQWTSILR